MKLHLHCAKCREADRPSEKLMDFSEEDFYEFQCECGHLFSLKVLIRLAQAEGLQINVDVSAKLKEGVSVEQLNAALRDLGIAGEFTKE